MDTLDVSARDRWVRDLEVVRTLMLGGLAEFLLACCGAPLSGWCRALRAWTRVQDHLPGPGIGLRVSRDPAVGVFRAASCVLRGYSRPVGRAGRECRATRAGPWERRRCARMVGGGQRGPARSPLALERAVAAGGGVGVR